MCMCMCMSMCMCNIHVCIRETVHGSLPLIMVCVWDFYALCCDPGSSAGLLVGLLPAMYLEKQKKVWESC